MSNYQPMATMDTVVTTINEVSVLAIPNNSIAVENPDEIEATIIIDAWTAATTQVDNAPSTLKSLKVVNFAARPNTKQCIFKLFKIAESNFKSEYNSNSELGLCNCVESIKGE